jgi:hypothetical protein
MSALGHKQTFAVQNRMSAFTPDNDRESGFPHKVIALPPKADMCSALTHVRFGPKAESPHLNLPHKNIGGGEHGCHEADIVSAEREIIDARQR